MNAEQVEKDWQRRGFSFGIWEDPPGRIWKDYVHDVDELFMVIEDEVTLTMSGKTLVPEIGEEILISAGEKHTVSTSNADGSRWYYGYKKSLPDNL